MNVLDPVTNFAKVTVSTGYTDANTSIVLTTGHGTLLPQPSTDGAFNCTWWDYTAYPNPEDDPNKEIVRVTARSTDTLTVTRAQEGTTATNKNTAGHVYKMVLSQTKKLRDDIETVIANENLGIVSAGSETWSYSGSDSPSYVFNVNADVTQKYSEGMRVRYEQAQALSVYWTFDSSSTPDVGSATMTNIGTPTYTAGKFNNALTLDGSTDGLAITDATMFKPADNFCFGMWFKTSASGTQKCLFHSWSINPNVAGLSLQTTTANTLEFVVGNNTGTTHPTNYIAATGNTVVTDGNWHYVVVSVRNGYAQMYLDGVLEAENKILTPTYAATNYVGIGFRRSTGTNELFFNGQIDDLFFINGYALDEVTIRDKYRAGTAQGTGNITVKKWGIITKVGAYSGGNTPITIYGGTDYALVNATISNPYYSTMKVPFGFPASRNKWSVIFRDDNNRSQASPTANTWYNLGSVYIAVPIGVWDLLYSIYTEVNNTTGYPNVHFTLSTSNSSETIRRLTTRDLINNASAAGGNVKTMSDIISMPVKTNLYPLIKTDFTGATSITIGGGSSPLIIKATCSYL